MNETLTPHTQIKGTLNTDMPTLAAKITVKVPLLPEITIGTVNGHLKDGISVNVNVAVVKGSVTFFMKNGKEVWVKLELTSKLFPPINRQFRIIALCKLFSADFHRLQANIDTLCNLQARVFRGLNPG